MLIGDDYCLCLHVLMLMAGQWEGHVACENIFDLCMVVALNDH